MSGSSAIDSGGATAVRGRRVGGRAWRRARRVAGWLRNVMPDRLLFNPVFWKDSAITARKKGTFAFRGLYMLLVIGAVGVAAVPLASTLSFAGPAERMQAGSMFASTLAQVIQWTQFFALMLAGPIIASGAIAMEKTNRSLDSLYATPLTRAQIMWGKLTSRLLQIVVLALMPVPILLMLRAFGGIDTMVTLKQTGLILSSAALTTSMGLLASVYSKRPWAVVGSTMVILVLLHLVAPVLLYRAFGAGMPTPWWLLVGALCIAPVYPFWGVSAGGLGAGMGLGIAASPAQVFAVAVALQCVLVVLITSGSSLLLRRVERPRGSRRGGLSEAYEAEPAVAAGVASGTDAGGTDEPTSVVKPGRRRRRRRARGSRVVGDYPVFWRELRQPSVDLGRFAWLGWILFPAIGFGIAVLFFVEMPNGDRPYREAYSYAMLYSIVGLYLLMVAISRTTSLIPHERSARTWDVLRTTPMGPLEIVLQKYFGSIAKPALFAGALMLVFVPSIVLGVYHWMVVPFLAIALLQAIGLLSATGMLLGTMLRKGLAATGANLGVAFALWLLLPIGVAVVTDSFEGQGPQLQLMMINPFVQSGVSMAGCYELSPNELRWKDAVWEQTAFSWPDEERTMRGHAGLMIGSGVAYAAAIAGCLGLAAWRVRKLRPNA